MVIYFNLRYKLDPTENGLRADYDDGFDKETVNIYEIIEQKENDLLLAAELGTALLDKNEEISRHREKIVMDYTQKMEVLFTVIKLCSLCSSYSFNYSHLIYLREALTLKEISIILLIKKLNKRRVQGN